MELVKLSMRGFAEVSSAAPNRKQSTLKRFRSPNSGESVGRSNYYVKALSLIKRHHKGESVATDLAKLLDAANADPIPRSRTKLLSNYRAATDYLAHFGNRKLKIRTGKQLYYIFENLVISAQPDIVAESDDGELLLIKINLSRKDFAGGVSGTVLHVLYESAKAKGLPVQSWGVECLQTTSGSRTVGPKTGFPDKQALNAECKAILALCSYQAA